MPSPSSLDLDQRKEARSFSSQEETDKDRGGKALSLSLSTKNSMEEKLCSDLKPFYFIFKKEPVAYGVNSIKKHMVVASK